MLKETIDKTRELTNNVKIAKNEINDAIVRGGGVQSTSVAEVPDNITKMLGQYSKVASGSFSCGNRLMNGTEINMNLAFTPKRIIACVSSTNVGVRFDRGSADSSKHYSEGSAYRVEGNNRMASFWIYNITKSKFTIGTGREIGYEGVLVSWIALG